MLARNDDESEVEAFVTVVFVFVFTEEIAVASCEFVFEFTLPVSLVTTLAEMIQKNLLEMKRCVVKVSVL